MSRAHGWRRLAAGARLKDTCCADRPVLQRLDRRNLASCCEARLAEGTSSPDGDFWPGGLVGCEARAAALAVELGGRDLEEALLVLKDTNSGRGNVEWARLQLLAPGVASSTIERPGGSSTSHRPRSAVHATPRPTPSVRAWCSWSCSRSECSVPPIRSCSASTGSWFAQRSPARSRPRQCSSAGPRPSLIATIGVVTAACPQPASWSVTRGRHASRG